MDWTPDATGNAMAAAWLGLAVTGAVLRQQQSRDKTVHSGTGLVFWGSYLVAVLALNLHTSPFGTLPLAARYAGVAGAGASIAARLVLLAIGSRARNAALRRAVPISMAIFCVSLTAASGDVIALVTVFVASSAAVAVELADVSARDWDTSSR